MAPDEDPSGTPIPLYDMRKFATGATRDADDGKYDYEGFLSPFALERFAAYMHKHRKQSDGELRDSDNWQKGMSEDVYLKSLWRHMHAAWTIHRGGEVTEIRNGLPVDMEEAVCGVLFNAMGILHERCRPSAHEAL
jgi:hypothetical protein